MDWKALASYPGPSHEKGEVWYIPFVHAPGFMGNPYLCALTLLADEVTMFTIFYVSSSFCPSQSLNTVCEASKAIYPTNLG